MTGKQHQHRQKHERQSLHDDAGLHQLVRAPRIPSAPQRSHPEAEHSQRAEHRKHEQNRQKYYHPVNMARSPDCGQPYLGRGIRILVPSGDQAARDDLGLDLGGAFEDVEDTGVA